MTEILNLQIWTVIMMTKKKHKKKSIKKSKKKKKKESCISRDSNPGPMGSKINHYIHYAMEADRYLEKNNQYMLKL